MHKEANASPRVPAPLTTVSEVPSNLPDNAPGTPCFHIHTDPTSAFSRKSQRTCNNSPNQFSTPVRSASPGPERLNTTPSSGHHYNQSHSSDQRLYGAPMPYQPCGSWRSPIGMTSPFPQQHGTPAVWNRQSGASGYGMPPNSPTVGGFPSPGFGQVVSPRPSPGRGIANQFNTTPSPNFGYQFNNTPNPSFGNQFNIPSPSIGHVVSPNPNIRGNHISQFSNSPSFGNQFNNIRSPGFGRVGSPNPNIGGSSISQFSNSPKPSFRPGSPGLGTPRSSGHQVFNNSSPNTQSSSRHWVGNNPSPCSGQGHKKGKGIKGPVSARERPDLFYKRSMLEDPWKSLKPVVRQSTPKSWLPESISKQKEEKTVSDEPKVKLSGVSFADLLNASFEQAAGLGTSAAPSDDDVNNV